MTVPPATGPLPVYSTASPAASMSAVDQLLVRGVLSFGRTGLVGCDRDATPGFDMPRESIGRERCVGLAWLRSAESSASLRNWTLVRAMLSTDLHDDAEGVR